MKVYTGLTSSTIGETVNQIFWRELADLCLEGILRERTYICINKGTEGKNVRFLAD